MFTIYALYSPSIDRLYIGQTSDLEKRLASHLSGSYGFTARASDWKVIYAEVTSSRSEARKREGQLKSSRGRAYLRGLLEQGGCYQSAD